MKLTTSFLFIVHLRRRGYALPVLRLNSFKASSNLSSHQFSTNRETAQLHPLSRQKSVFDDVTEKVSPETIHDVNGIKCREVKIFIEKVGPVIILEATADSQNELVDIALATEDEIASMGKANNLQLNSGDPYGAVLWPAASAVANHLLTSIRSETLKELTVVELGTGTGLVSIAAALGGVHKVIATDYEKIPLELLEYASTNIDQSSGDLDRAKERKRKLSNIETTLFDICNHDVPLPSADIVVAADIMYETKTGIAMAYRVVEALRAGSRVIVGCSPGRYCLLSRFFIFFSNLQCTLRISSQ